MKNLAKMSTTDVQLESSFERVSPLEMHKTDHCERICRRPGGRVVIRRLSLTESNLADFIEGVSRTSVLNNNVSFAVELKSPVHTERLFAVISKIPDGIVNDQSPECPDSVDAFERSLDKFVLFDWESDFKTGTVIDLLITSLEFSQDRDKEVYSCTTIRC